MMIAVDRDQLAAAVSRAVQGLPQNPVIPIRAGMHVLAKGECISLTCGDQDVTFTADCPAGVLQEGSCVLPGKMTAELIRYLPKQDVIITLEGKEVTVESGRSSFTLGAKPGDEYPEWAAPPAPLCTLDGAVLAAGLRKVAPAASDDLAQLSGVQLSLRGDILVLVATDKYKLGMMELANAQTETNHRTASEDPETKDVAPSDNAQTHTATAYLPSRVAEKFARACEGEASIGWSGNPKLISLRSEGLQVVVRQVEGRLPQGWENIIQAGDWHSCETAELTRAVRMASLAATDDRIELTFGDGEVIVEAGSAHQAIACAYPGEPVSLAVGGRNLLAGLGGCGEQVDLAFTAPRKPLLLDSEGLRWLVQTRGERPA